MAIRYIYSDSHIPTVFIEESIVYPKSKEACSATTIGSLTSQRSNDYCDVEFTVEKYLKEAQEIQKEFLERRPITVALSPPIQGSSNKEGSQKSVANRELMMKALSEVAAISKARGEGFSSGENKLGVIKRFVQLSPKPINLKFHDPQMPHTCEAPKPNETETQPVYRQEKWNNYGAVNGVLKADSFKYCYSDAHTSQDNKLDQRAFEKKWQSVSYGSPGSQKKIFIDYSNTFDKAP